jgi:hypothetical protein
MRVTDRVKVAGLVNSAQYNGLEGEVSGIDADKARISVILDVGITLAVKQENLVLLTTVQPIFDHSEIAIPHVLPKHLLEYLGFAGSEGWRRVEQTETSGSTFEREPKILCQVLNSCDNSTLKTYGCFGKSSRHYINHQSSVNVFDISCFFPCSALAGAVLKDPVAIDYYAERYFLLRDLPESGPNGLAEAFTKYPQFYELKTNSGGFSVGDDCKVFEGPSPHFTNLCQHLNDRSKANAKHDAISDFIQKITSFPAICILFTVGPIFNKLFITDSRVIPSQKGPPSASEGALLRECAIRLAQKKVRMLRRYISHVQQKVNARSRDWLRELETSLFLQGAQGAGSGVEHGSSDMEACLGMMQGTDLRWARCTTEEVAATSRLLAPVNRMRMCSTEYSPKKLNGEKSAYQSLLSSQTLPEHECVEVSLHERVAAHISAVSSQPLASASPEERSKIIGRSTQALYPGHSLDSLSRKERMAVFANLSPMCPGVAAVLQAQAAVREAGCLIPVRCDGGERVTQVVSTLSCALCLHFLSKIMLVQTNETYLCRRPTEADFAALTASLRSCRVPKNLAKKCRWRSAWASATPETRRWSRRSATRRPAKPGSSTGGPSGPTMIRAGRRRPARAARRGRAEKLLRLPGLRCDGESLRSATCACSCAARPASATLCRS